MSVNHLTFIPLTNVLQAVSNNVNSTKTTASQNVDVADLEDENTLEKSPQDFSGTNFTNGSTTTIEPLSIDTTRNPASTDKLALRGDDTNDAEMSAAPQLLTTATKETPVPAWPSQMLIYLRGVFDTTKWQDLVSALLKFENLNPPSGISTPLRNSDFSSNLILETSNPASPQGNEVLDKSPCQ